MTMLEAGEGTQQAEQQRRGERSSAPGPRSAAPEVEAPRDRPLTDPRPGAASSDASPGPADTVLATRDVVISYSGVPAVRNVDLDVQRGEVTAIIGPSGCGKSTLLRGFNRMNDFIEGASVTGQVLFEGIDVHASDIDPVELRRRIGMVFQRPNPFPKSIYDNVAWGPRMGGYTGDMDELVERSLGDAALWDEVKDKLKQPGHSLSGGQQQRLCIARALAMSPEVLLMDEPCSALDPIATGRIEDLIESLRGRYSVVIVTHNMQQASRISDTTVFMYQGELIEVGATARMFTNPEKQQTEDYVTGRFG